MEIQHDKEGHRFYILIDGSEVGELSYRQSEKTLDLYHTYVSPTIRERGLAQRLVEEGFHYAQANQLLVIPSCPYISEQFLKKHPEYLSLIAK